jgi:putative transposase
MRKRYTNQFKAQVVQEILKEEKTLNQLAAEHSVHPNQLKRWKAIALEGLPRLFSKDDQAAQAAAVAHEQQVSELYAEIGRLTTELTWLKKKLACSPRAERVALVDHEQPTLPLTRQAELLSLSRSGLYYVPRPVSAAEITIKHAIDEIYTQYPFYGSRRITVELREQCQLRVARETVQRYMREMGITAIYPGPNLSRRHPEHRVYPYLLHNVTAAYPNHVWGIDITYIRLHGGWLYLVAVIDWFSRYVVSWELDQTLEMPFVVSAVERALAQTTPVIWNSDQGSHFTSPQYTQLLLAAGAQISMDGKGRASDNVFTERLWRTVKYEEVYLNDYAHPKAARRSLTSYFGFYNHLRRHQALAYHTPASIYAQRPAGSVTTATRDRAAGEAM